MQRALFIAAATVALASAASCPSGGVTPLKGNAYKKGGCPAETAINKCDQWGDAVCQKVAKSDEVPTGCAKFCEGNGECGTEDLNNCFDSSATNPEKPFADMYKVADCDESECGGGGGGGGDITDICVPPPKKVCGPRIKIITMGDSITYGRHGKDQIPGVDGSWPAWLAYELNEAGHAVKVLNKGVSGATAQNVGYRPYKGTEEWGEVKEELKKTDKPVSIVISTLGTNDAKTKCEPEYPGTCPDGMWDGNGLRYKKQYTELLEEIIDMAPDCTLVMIGISTANMCHAKFEPGADPRGGTNPDGTRNGCVGDDILRDWGDDASSADRINLDLPRIQYEIADELCLPTIDFRPANGDVIDANGIFKAIAQHTVNIRVDSVHFAEEGYKKLAEEAIPKLLDATTNLAAEEAAPAPGDDDREHSHDHGGHDDHGHSHHHHAHSHGAHDHEGQDVVSVKVPTLVAVVFLAAFALGAWAALLLLRGAASRDTAAEPLLGKEKPLESA